MKKLAFLICLATASCGGTTPGNEGSGGASTSATSTTATSASATTSAGATTGAGGGCGATTVDACGACMAGACCDALTACDADPACAACVKGTDSEACESTEETHARVDAFLSCRGGACATTCIGAAGECKDALNGIVSPTCQACLEAKCCDEVGACKAKDTCWIDCYTQHDEAKCHADPDGHALYHAFGTCYQASCDAECAAPSVDLVCDGLPATPPSGGTCIKIGTGVTCNPVTSEACTGAGSACDASSTGYTCYGPPNTQALCATCGADSFCSAGMTCAGGKCGRYCCDDADCGTAGTCDTTVVSGGVGVCVKKP